MWWPNLDIDIERVITCTACQHMQSSPPTASANPWIWLSKPWQRIHIDFAGPFLGEMFLVVVDTYSKWMEVVRMTSTTSENTINVVRTLYSSHGIPNYLVSDNPVQFTGAEFQIFRKKNGIKHIFPRRTIHHLMERQNEQ